jgi:hypothetical protein
MAGGMQEIGLKAVLDTTQFQAGMKIYLDGTLRMESETARAARESAARTEEMANKQKAALQKVGLAFAAVGAAGTALLSSIALVASRTEELGVILDVTAENARRLATEEARTAEARGDAAAAAVAMARASELNAQAVDAEVKKVKELGITTQASSLLVAQMIRYNLDWKKATDLAALAQDAATFAAQDSSEALEGLIHGITTLNPRVLRTYGLLVNLDSAYTQWAQANGRTTESLTDTEKVAIALNQVLAQGPAIAGAYEAAMDTASKQIRSLKRDVMEVSEEFGQALVPALNAAVGGFRDLLHWLRDLPDPVQSTAVTVLAVATGLTTVASAAAVVIPKIVSLTQAFRDLAVVQNLASAGLLGPAGLVAGLAAAAAATILYTENVEKAHRAEAASILEASTSYVSYAAQVKDAGLESYGFSQALYDMVKAAQEAGNALDAIKLQDARQDLQDMLEGTQHFGMTLDMVTAALQGQAKGMSDYELLVLSSAQETYNWAIQAGYGTEQANSFSVAITNLAKTTIAAREATENYNRFESQRGDILLGIMNATETYEDTLRENLNWTEILTQREKARYDNLVKLAGAERDYAAASQEATERAAEQMVDAEEKADKSREQARRSLLDQQAALEKDHAGKVADILKQIAQVDIDLLKDRAKAEQDAARDRIQAAEDLARDLANAEQKYNQDREDAHQDLIRKLDDLERGYEQDREDALRDLNRDLEELERDHTGRMAELEADYYADLESMAQDYGRTVASITEKYAAQRQAILKKYEVDVGPDIDQQRQDLLDQIRELEKLREGKRGYNYYVYQPKIDELQKQLNELKKIELDALDEQQQEELAQAEEDYNEQRDQRLTQYEQDKVDEIAAYEGRKAERERQYQEKLEDLRIALEREQETARLAEQRKLEDLAAAYETNKAEIARRYAERLGQIDAALTEEKTRLDTAAEENKTRLEQQLADEQANYADRQTELTNHYNAQLAEIDAALAEEKEKIQTGLAEELAQIITDLGDQSQAFRDAYAQQLTDLDAYLAERLAKEAEYQRQLQDMYGIQSPSKWMIDFGKKLSAGLEIGVAGGDGASLMSGLGDMLGGLQSSLGSLVPGSYQPPAMMFPSGGGTTYNTTTQRNITMNADFSHSNLLPRIRDQFRLLEYAG